MKYLQRTTPLISLVMVFTLALIILPNYWQSKHEALFFIIGFWIIGEAASQLYFPKIKFSSDNAFRNHLQGIVTARISVGLGGLIMIISMFLPWFQTAQPLYGVSSSSGYSTDGLQIGLAGFVPIVVALFRKNSRKTLFHILHPLGRLCIKFFI